MPDMKEPDIGHGCSEWELGSQEPGGPPGTLFIVGIYYLLPPPQLLGNILLNVLPDHFGEEFTPLGAGSLAGDGDWSS